MSTSINLRFQPSIDDYIRVLTSLKKMRFTHRYGYFIFPVILFFLFVFAIYFLANDKSQIRYFPTFLFSAIPASVLGLLMFFIRDIPPIYEKSQISKQMNLYPVMQQEIEVKLTDESFESSSQLSTNTVRWEALLIAIETDTDFLFKITPIGINFLPKVAFDNAADQNQFREMLKSKMGERFVAL